MNENIRIKTLIDKYGYHEGTARAYVLSRGKCAYCDEDLFETRMGYSSGEIDHILPKAVYPGLEMNYDNWILGCSSCNKMKHNLDVLKKGESPEDMITNHREELIRRARSELAEKIRNRNREYLEIKKIIQSE